MPENTPYTWLSFAELADQYVKAASDISVMIAAAKRSMARKIGAERDAERRRIVSLYEIHSQTVKSAAELRKYAELEAKDGEKDAVCKD